MGEGSMTRLLSRHPQSSRFYTSRGIMNFFYRLYQYGMDRYQSARDPITRKSIEAMIRLAVLILMRCQGIRFPRRSTGGMRWIWGWRLEFLMGWNEPESVKWCRQLICPGMTVIDIGAHIGYFTRLFSELVGSSGRVLAFEPHPENVQVLRANLKKSRYKNVEIFHSAISDRTGAATLYVSPGHSNHSLLPGYTETKGQVEVECFTLDAFLSSRGIREVDFIKIDVEGSEPFVLAGMKQTVSQSPALRILAEFNPQALRCGGIPPAEFIHIFQKTGFEVKGILPDGSLGEVPPTLDQTINLLCVPHALAKTTNDKKRNRRARRDRGDL
ncbi:MAG: FkbM family methyltransferase [Deltaproteobacteria bacterium]|nr:MAG: FkbM family methyltransferase [Deltaproteobacteria bacterium]